MNAIAPVSEIKIFVKNHEARPCLAKIERKSFLFLPATSDTSEACGLEI